MKDMACANLERRLVYVAQQLEGRDYLLGGDSRSPTPTCSPCWLVQITCRSTCRPGRCCRPTRRVAARPAVQAALKAEGLV